MTHEHQMLSFTLSILPESEVVTNKDGTYFILANGKWTIIVSGRYISLISMNFYLYHYCKTITLTLDCIID